MQASIIYSVCVKLIPHCSVLWYESALFMVVIVRVFDILVCCVQVLCGCVMSFRYCSNMNMHLPITGALFSNNYMCNNFVHFVRLYQSLYQVWCLSVCFVY